VLKRKLTFIEYFNKILSSDLFNRSIPNGFFEDVDNKKIKINLKDIDYIITVLIKDNSLSLLDDDEDFDVEFVTTPATLILFILSKGSDKFSSNIIINGDIETANKFNKFLSSSDKLKEIIIHLIGENKTNIMEEKINKASSFFKEVFLSSSKDIIDLFTDDLSVIPSKSDVDQYLDEVDSLKSRTDKLYQKYKDAK
tara:strand:+ start:885 stop:1475 length:591 start_codon:yes stop_codon:yes gene_type:complete